MNILIADDNEMVRYLIKSYFAKDEDINVVAELSNGLDVIKLVKEKNVDVIILDMMMPEKDGLAVLEEMDAQEEFIGNVHCILVTAIGDECISKRAFELGVDYVMLKPFNLNDLRRRILEYGNKGHKVKDHGIIIPLETEVDVKNKVSILLNEIGFTPNLRGYKFIKSAIMCSYHDNTLLDGITKSLYPKVAKEKQTFSTHVERSIRSAIEITWDKRGGESFNNALGDIYFKEDKRPSNGEFLAGVVEWLKLEFNDSDTMR